MQIVKNNKFVELSYQIIDQKTGDVLTEVEFPLGYVHGDNEVLLPEVSKELEGKTIGSIIELPIDCDKLYGKRDESLVVTDYVDNVPKQYRELGTVITMENEKGSPKEFIVTRMDDKTLTVDGNNPLCGREVIFKLTILSIRDATKEEIKLGGAIDNRPDDLQNTVSIN